MENPIKNAVEILRHIRGTPADIGHAWLVADELEALLKQEPVAEVTSHTQGSYHRNYKIEWFRQVDAGALLYAAQVSAEPVNARLLDAAYQMCLKINARESVERMLKDEFIALQEAIAAAEQANPLNIEGLSSDPMHAFEQGREAGRAEAFEAAEQAKPAPELTDEQITRAAALTLGGNCIDAHHWSDLADFARAAIKADRELRGEWK